MKKEKNINGSPQFVTMRFSRHVITLSDQYKKFCFYSCHIKKSKKSFEDQHWFADHIVIRMVPVPLAVQSVSQICVKPRTSYFHVFLARRQV